MITDSSIAASDSHGRMLCRPLKYPRVTYQNCPPQVVNLAITNSTARVHTAAISQALPTHSSESARA